MKWLLKTADPITRDQLAYAGTIIKEAQCQGGLAWLDSDKAVRQQLAPDTLEHHQPQPVVYWSRFKQGQGLHVGGD